MGHKVDAGVAIESDTPTICFGFNPEPPPIDPQHRLRARSAECDRPRQAGARAIGPIFATTYVCRSCNCNAVHALQTRHLCPFAPMSRTLECPGHFIAAIAAEYQRLLPATREGWIAKWPVAKQLAIYRSEHEERVMRGRVKPSVKREAAHKRPSKSRLIQAYYNLVSQCEFAVEHSIFQKALCAVADSTQDGAGYEIFPGVRIAATSGWSAAKLSTWADDHAGCTLYERDGERWDSTMQRAHHEIKWSAMRACSDELAQSVADDYEVTGTYTSPHGDITYRACGTVKSGHNDTTSGNTLVNLCIAASALRDCGLRGSIIAIGDDLLAAIDGPADLTAIADAERSYGILPTVQPRRDFSDATYASGTWLHDGRRHLYVPLLGRLIARQWWSTHPPSPKKARLHRHGIASGMLSLVEGIPVYEDFYKPHLLRLPRMEYVGHRPHGHHDVRGFDFDCAFSNRYGLTPLETAQLASFFRSLPTDPAFHAVYPRPLDKVFAIDVPEALVGAEAAVSLREDGVIR